jgi:excisionase family DNA binding protein
MERSETAGLLDVEQAANFLHIKPATVRSWILKNRVTFVRLGRRVFLRHEDLVALVAASVVPAAQGEPERKK